MNGRFRKAYLIDDDLTFNVITKMLLTRFGFAEEIIEYSDASNALSNLKRSDEAYPEVIFLDLNMPGMDGWSFLNEYQSLPENITKECKLYILTSSISDADRSKSLSYSFVEDFITKPLAFDRVQQICEEV